MPYSSNFSFLVIIDNYCLDFISLFFIIFIIEGYTLLLIICLIHYFHFCTHSSLPVNFWYTIGRLWVCLQSVPTTSWYTVTVTVRQCTANLCQTWLGTLAFGTTFVHLILIEFKEHFKLVVFLGIGTGTSCETTAPQKSGTHDSDFSRKSGTIRRT